MKYAIKYFYGSEQYKHSYASGWFKKSFDIYFTRDINDAYRGLATAQTSCGSSYNMWVEETEE